MPKYRPNVGIVVFNKNKQVLLCRRKKNSSATAWQFPQGGIENGEETLAAGLRELKEETSVVSVRFVAQIKKHLRYNFPLDLMLSNKDKGYPDYIGQEQSWLLFYFYGSDEEINVQTKEQEFSQYKWATFEEAENNVWIVKKDVYKKVRSAFEPLVKEFRIS